VSVMAPPYHSKRARGACVVRLFCGFHTRHSLVVGSEQLLCCSLGRSTPTPPTGVWFWLRLPNLFSRTGCLVGMASGVWGVMLSLCASMRPRQAWGFHGCWVRFLVAMCDCEWSYTSLFTSWETVGVKWGYMAMHLRVDGQVVWYNAEGRPSQHSQLGRVFVGLRRSAVLLLGLVVCDAGRPWMRPECMLEASIVGWSELLGPFRTCGGLQMLFVVRSAVYSWLGSISVRGAVWRSFPQRVPVVCGA